MPGAWHARRAADRPRLAARLPDLRARRLGDGRPETPCAARWVRTCRRPADRSGRQHRPWTRARCRRRRGARTAGRRRAMRADSAAGATAGREGRWSHRRRQRRRTRRRQHWKWHAMPACVGARPTAVKQGVDDDVRRPHATNHETNASRSRCFAAASSAFAPAASALATCNSAWTARYVCGGERGAESRDCHAAAYSRGLRFARTRFASASAAAASSAIGAAASLDSTRRPSITLRTDPA